MHIRRGLARRIEAQHGRQVGIAHHRQHDFQRLLASNREGLDRLAECGRSLVGRPFAAPAATLAPPTAGEGRFGEPVAGAGDVDGDAYADIAIGATDTKGGTVYVYLGSGAGAAAVPPVALTAPDGPSSGFGASLATTY